MKTLNDNALLLAITEKHDQEAFTELFERYREYAYNLALKVTHDSALAEDIIQETMLSLWKTTKSFNSDGNVRGLITKIVMRESLDLLKMRRRSQKREENKRSMQGAEVGTMVAETYEKKELCLALSEQIDLLPDLDRQLVACYYGAEMKQEEIAELLALPQKAISRQLQKALDRLRANLTKAGFAAAGPLLSAEYLSKAVLTGHECPPGMTERMMSRIANAGSEVAKAVSRRATLHVATAKSASIAGNALLIGGAIVSALGVAGVFLFGKKTEQPKQSAPPAAVQPAPAARPFQVLRQFNLPPEWPVAYSLACDGTALWLSFGAASPVLFKLNPETGERVGSLDLAGKVKNPYALAWDGSQLFVSDPSEKSVFTAVPASGSVKLFDEKPEVASMAREETSHKLLYARCHALVHFNGEFWCARGDDESIYALNNMDVGKIRNQTSASFGVPDFKALRSVQVAEAGDVIFGLAPGGQGSLWVLSYRAEGSQTDARKGTANAVPRWIKGKIVLAEVKTPPAEQK